MSREYSYLWAALFIVAAPLLASSQSVGIIGTNVPTNVASVQSLIAWSDFTYQGSYSVPVSTPGTTDTRFTTGLTGYYTAGNLHFFGFSGAVTGSGLYEFDLNGQSPIINTSIAALNSVRILQDYGNPFWLQGQGAGSGCTDFFGPVQVYSIRAIGSRLFWGYGNAYPPSGCDYDGGLGFNTINTYGVAPSSPHSYTLNPLGYKPGEHGFVEMPSTWSDGTYPNLSGMNIAQASGGYESIVTVGNTSIGPSLIPFVQPIGNESQRATLANYPLMYFAQACATRSFKPVMSPVYVNGSESPACASDVWGTLEAVRGVEWINTTHRKGIMHFMTFSTGDSEYVGAIIVGRGYINEVLITDPVSLIPVATGAVAVGSVGWGSNTVTQYPFYDYTTPCAGFASCPDVTISALTITGPTAVATVADSSLITTSSRIDVFGANQSEFNSSYRPADIIDATHFRICSGGNGGTITDPGGTCTGADFANQTATGSIKYRALQAGGFALPTGSQGSWFDTTTNTLWLWATNNLTQMVLNKYTCASC